MVASAAAALAADALIAVIWSPVCPGKTRLHEAPHLYLMVVHGVPSGVEERLAAGVLDILGNCCECSLPGGEQAHRPYAPASALSHAVAEWLATNIDSSTAMSESVGRGSSYEGVLLATFKSQRSFRTRDAAALRLLGSSVEVAVDAALATAEVRARQEEILAFHSIVNEITALASLDHVLKTLCETASRLLSGSAAFIAMADAKQSEIAVRITHGLDDPGWTNLQLLFGEGVGGLVASRREAIVIDDYSTFTHATPIRVKRLMESEGLKSVVCVPMEVAENIVGVLYVADSAVGRFGGRAARLLARLAAQAAVAIANADLYERERKEVQIHRQLVAAVMSQGDAQHTAYAAYALVDNPVALFDKQHRLLSSYPPSLPQALVDEGVTVGTALPPWSETSRPRMKADGPHAVLLERCPDEGRSIDRIIAPVGPHDGAGFLHVLGVDHGLGEQDLRPAEMAAILLTLHLLRERHDAELEQRVRGELVDDVLEVDPQTADAAVRRAAHLGHDLRKPQFCLVIDASRLFSLAALERWSEEQLISRMQSVANVARASCLKLGVSAIVGSKGHRIVAIVECPGVDSEEHASYGNVIGKTVAAALSNKLPYCRFLIGIGAPKADVHGVPKSYGEATVCCHLAESSEEPYVVFGALGLLSMMAESLQNDQLRSLVDLHLNGIISYDCEHDADLLSTLTSYLDHSCRKAETASALHIHVNTLKYRLGRIREICGLDLDSPDVRFEIHLATRVLRAEKALRSDGGGVSRKPR